MNREQAREIAETVFSEWRVCGGTLRHMIADALHAAYEKDRAVPAACQDSRLASIKETARRMFASDIFRCDSKACLEMAELFEDAFERRYGGGR